MTLRVRRPPQPPAPASAKPRPPVALHIEIVKAYDGGNGMTPTKIAEVAGISRERVHQIVRRDKSEPSTEGATS